METEHRTTAEPKFPKPHFEALRCLGCHALVILHRALKACVRMLGNPKAIIVRLPVDCPN